MRKKTINDELQPRTKVSDGENESECGWQLLVLPKIESVPLAKQNWRILSEAGVDLEEVAAHLHRFCGGTKEELKVGLRAARQFRARFAPGIREIERAATTVRVLSKDLSGIAGIKIHDPDFDKLPSLMERFANELKEYSDQVQRNVARGVKVDKSGRISGDGRTESLVVLVGTVAAVTDEPYALLAPLVAVIRGDVNPSYGHIADSLRKICGRHKKKTPFRW